MGDLMLPAPPYFMTGERLQIGADALALLDDAGIAVTVTYRDFLGETFDVATGAKVRSYTDTTCVPGTNGGAIVNDLTAREVLAAPGLYETGDRRFTVARLSGYSNITPPLGSAVPSRDDRILYGGETFAVISWSSDPMALFWMIVARKVQLA